jgi:hypothetical protein
MLSFIDDCFRNHGNDWHATGLSLPVCRSASAMQNRVLGAACVPITVGQKLAAAIHPIASGGGVQYSCHAGIGYAWFELSMSLTMGNERGGSGQLSQREKPGNFRFMAWWLHSRGSSAWTS